MLSQQQYTKELAEAERYHNSAARQQSIDASNLSNVGGSCPNNNNKQQYTDEENEAYNTIINNIKDPQELYAILHEMKRKRLHRTANNNNSKPHRHRYKRQQRRSKSKRRVSRSSSSSSEDTLTLDVPSPTADRSSSFIDTLSNLLFPFHSIFQDTNYNDKLDEQEEDTPASSPFDNIMSFLGYDNSNTNDAGHYECGSSDSTTNAESTCSSFDSSTANNLADSFFNIMWNKKKSKSSSREKYRRSSSGSSAISPRNVEDSWVTKDELNEW